MAFMDMLNGLKGKALDIKDIELLKHAYDLQEENIKQLKTNNQALQENNDLLKEKTQNLQTLIQSLQQQIDDLKSNPPSPATPEFEPDTIDIKIMSVLSRNEGESVSEKTFLKLEPSATEVQYHLNNLVKQDFIDTIPIMGGDTLYILSDLGRKYLIDHKLLR